MIIYAKKKHYRIKIELFIKIFFILIELDTHKKIIENLKASKDLIKTDSFL